MKGTVVSIWLSTIEKIYGADVKRKAMSSVNWPVDKLISPLDDIVDKDIFSLVEVPFWVVIVVVILVL